MSFSQIVQGEVGSVARGINVSNAQSNQQGLATVNPIFTWVRLAQRVPVRIRIKELPDGVRLVAGMTATVEMSHDERLRLICNIVAVWDNFRLRRRSTVGHKQ